jgi:hypothetical protein
MVAEISQGSVLSIFEAILPWRESCGANNRKGWMALRTLRRSNSRLSSERRLHHARCSRRGARNRSGVEMKEKIKRKHQPGSPRWMNGYFKPHGHFVKKQIHKKLRKMKGPLRPGIMNAIGVPWEWS